MGVSEEWQGWQTFSEERFQGAVAHAFRNSSAQLLCLVHLFCILQAFEDLGQAPLVGHPGSVSDRIPVLKMLMFSRGRAEQVLNALREQNGRVWTGGGVPMGFLGQEMHEQRCGAAQAENMAGW